MIERETGWRSVAMVLGLILSAVGGAWYGPANVPSAGRGCQCVSADYARVAEVRETTQKVDRALALAERVRDSLNTHLQGRGSGTRGTPGVPAETAIAH